MGVSQVLINKILVGEFYTMKKIITLNKKDGSKVKAVIKILDISYIDKILDLQQEIYDLLEQKEFY